ncbi:MAG: GNAT family N-acetyltransferase [Acutalibacteraceae bacterium]
MQIRSEKVKFRSSDVKQIYFDSFPKNERMPFWMMVAMSKLWNTDFFEYYDGDKLCGFAYLAHIGKTVFVMFLAVDKSLRSKGYGSAILREIQNRYPDKKIIISIEPCDKNAPDIELRTRRKDFYIRNGYKDTGYMMRLNGVAQEIIITNGEFNKNQFRAFFALYSNGTVWPKIWQKTEQE